MSSPTFSNQATWDNFHIKGMVLRYSSFVPRLYNFCKSLGFQPGKIMPSRAFCSDESQGYPIILIAKHFGTFPFDHGRVGGIVATDRHGPHATHGKDMVIIQASHVGYNPDNGHFGEYRRLQTTCNDISDTCGKLAGVAAWFQQEYLFAQQNIYINTSDDGLLITIDNQLLNQRRRQGLLLHLDKLIRTNDEGLASAVHSLSTAKTYHASELLSDALRNQTVGTTSRPIGSGLQADFFYFKHQIKGDQEGVGHMENILLHAMPWIVTSDAPLLLAAQINTQVEFDRSFRTIVKEKGYQGKNVVYIAGLNIDISPQPGQLFPLTKFVPWAAFIQLADGTHYTLEQPEIMAKLMEQSSENPDQIDLEAAIHHMESLAEVKVHV